MALTTSSRSGRTSTRASSTWAARRERPTKTTICAVVPAAPNDNHKNNPAGINLFLSIIFRPGPPNGWQVTPIGRSFHSPNHLGVLGYVLLPQALAVSFRNRTWSEDDWMVCARQLRLRIGFPFNRPWSSILGPQPPVADGHSEFWRVVGALAVDVGFGDDNTRMVWSASCPL